MYRSSGLSEIVRDPSKITRHYLDVWFTAQGAFGKGLTLLGWPVSSHSSPLLVWDAEHGLRTDLKAEKIAMYSRTVLHYKKKNNEYVLGVDPQKVFFPRNIYGSLQALWSQSRWLIDYQRTYDQAKTWVEAMPLQPPNNQTVVEEKLAELVWPSVIAVDAMGEFLFTALTQNMTPEQKSLLLQNILQRNRQRDWSTQASLSWSNYQEGKLSSADMLKNYGLAAGDEYELTSPRYYELLQASMPVISELPIKAMKVQNLEDLVVGVQYLRSEAKHRNLIWIAALRESLKKSHKM
jgi:hypothetical protein